MQSIKHRLSTCGTCKIEAFTEENASYVTELGVDVAYDKPALKAILDVHR